MDYSTLSPNIRKTVKYLHDLGWDTVDSGDGSNYENGMACAVPYPMVVIQLDPDDDLCFMADTLFCQLKEDGIEATEANDPDNYPSGVHIDASYSPSSGLKVISIIGLHDGMMP